MVFFVVENMTIFKKKKDESSLTIPVEIISKKATK